MQDRLKIAAMVAASIFQGVPFDLEDFERTQETEDKERQACRQIARMAVMLAEEIIIVEGARPPMVEVERDVQARIQTA